MLALLAIACGSTSVTELTGPAALHCQTNLGSSPPSVSSTGGRVNVTVAANRECSWTASSDSSWASVSPTSGQGDGSLTVTIAANGVPNARTAALSVNDQRLTVAQEAAPCRYELSSTSLRVDASAGNASVGVDALKGCTWTAASTEAWVHVLTPTGNGAGMISLGVDRNTAGQRSARVTIAGQSLTVTQEAMPVPQPTPIPTPTPTPTPGPGPPPVPCTYSIDPTSKSFSKDGGSGSITVNTGQTCSWTASSSADWVEITSGASGKGGGSVSYAVSNFKGKDDRTATITVAGKTFTVTQKN